MTDNRLVLATHAGDTTQITPNALALGLDALGASVLGIDRDPERVAALPLRPRWLTRPPPPIWLPAGAFDSSAALVCLGAACDASVLATGHLADRGVGRKWVAARDGRHERVLRRVGADRILRPAQDATGRGRGRRAPSSTPLGDGHSGGHLDSGRSRRACRSGPPDRSDAKRS